MVCTYCGEPTQVTNSRHKKRTNIVWRRRRCTVCASIITTEESARYDTSWLVESAHGTLTPFSRDRLLISLYKSLGHRDNASSDASALTETIINQLRATDEARQAVLPQATLQDVIVSCLARFDTLASSHYRAYHPT